MPEHKHKARVTPASSMYQNANTSCELLYTKTNSPSSAFDCFRVFGQPGIIQRRCRGVWINGPLLQWLCKLSATLNLN